MSGDGDKRPPPKPGTAPAPKAAAPAKPVPAKQLGPTQSIPRRRSASKSSSFEALPPGPWSESMSDLKRVPTHSGVSSRELPRVGSDFNDTTASGARAAGASSRNLAPVTSTSSRNLPQVAGSSSRNLPPVTGASSRNLAPVTGASSRNLAPVTGASSSDLTPVGRKPSVYQKQLQSSGFEEEEHTQIDALLGKVRGVELDADEEESTASNPVFDGENPARQVIARDTWKAVSAPVQSRPGRRSARVTWNLIDQFAVANNPRYTPDATARSRAHIFAWDFTRAMGCEVPHVIAGRELSLGLTIDWLRTEGHNRGWRRADADGAVVAADRGEAVLAVPRDPKVKLIAVARPGGADESGHPRVASANLQRRGNDLSVVEALGTDSVEYFVHE